MARRLLAVAVCLALLLLSLLGTVSPNPAVAQGGTTEAHVVKYAPDGTTVLKEVTVTLAEMMADSPELPIYGDGETHYYFQGPIFVDEWQMAHRGETWNDTLICNGDTIPGTAIKFANAPACVEYDRWNPQEDTNCGGPEGAMPKDLGAVMGTAVNDLCNQAGGLSPGDTVKVRAIDGFYKEFPAEVFYEPSAAVGIGVLCWYTKDCQESFAGTGYVPDFNVGMRLAFLSDTTTNPWGYHIFGIKDMVDNFPSEIWHYYYGGPDDYYPSCGGFQVKWVNEIAIYSEGNSFLNTAKDNYILVILGVLIVALLLIGIMIGRRRRAQAS
jgi:hypothetical protein